MNTPAIIVTIVVMEFPNIKNSILIHYKLIDSLYGQFLRVGKILCMLMEEKYLY